MVNQFTLPISIDFDHDWSKINRVYNQLIKLVDEKKFQSHDQDEYYASIHNLGNFGGSMVVTYEFTKPNTWYIWNGKLLETLLPAKIYSLKQQMTDAGLNFISFSYSQHQGPISKHIDHKSPEEATDGHCNLNYIISCSDPDACTVATDGTSIEQYPSTAGSCWLLDTTTCHQVNNTGSREVFQIKIHNSFSEVKKFFEDLGPITQNQSTVD